MDRIILHIDLNNFYASVECLLNPKYKNVPMAVCGAVELRHGIVLSKNQIAKGMGVKTGETVWEAKRKCPNLVVCTPNFSEYLKYSKLVRSIYEKYTDKVESFGIDECWLDVTNSTKLFGDGETIANKIRNEVRETIGLTVSAGVSFNKITAKLASDYKKPDATTVITRENYEKFVYPMKVESLLYVGQETLKKLNRLAIFTIGDLANTNEKILEETLGRWGLYLSTYAKGNDTSEVKTSGISSIIKSIGNSITTSRDITTMKDAEIVFGLLGESVASRLREHGLKGCAVTIFVKYSNLEVVTRQFSLSYLTSSSTEITQEAMKLFEKNIKTPFSIRLLGVRVNNLCEVADEAVQLDFLGTATKRLKRDKLENAIDKIRGKYGTDSVKKAIICLDESLTEVASGKNMFLKI